MIGIEQNYSAGPVTRPLTLRGHRLPIHRRQSCNRLAPHKLSAIYRLLPIMLCSFGCLSLVAFPGGVACGQSQVRDAGVVDTSKPLQVLRSNDWFDGEEAQFVPPEVGESPDNPLRREGWLRKQSEERSSGAWDWLTDWGWDWDWGGGAWSLPGINADWVSVLVMIFLAILLVGIISLLVYHSLRDYLPKRFQTPSQTKRVEIDPSKVTDLPFEVRQQAVDPLAEAERLMRAQRFDEAIVWLYGYMLLALDQRRRIHLQRGKTNRMYLKEIDDSPSLVALVYRSMLLFESAFFGKHPVPAQRFAEVWGALDEFHRLIDHPIAESVRATGEIGSEVASV